MKISVLTDNNPGPHTPAEHGLSYFIEYDGIRLLFDTGQSDMFLKNAGLMNIDLATPDIIVLSHGHFDHGNGLDFLDGGHLICHPGCFVKRYRKSDMSYIGLKMSRNELAEKFEIHSSSEPVKVTEKIFFLGEIPRLTVFESRTTPFVFEDTMPDFVLDDSAIALILPEGLFIITGCGHSGLVNTVEHAKKVTGITKLFGVMGGFHLKGNGLQTRETIKYLKENNVTLVKPSHCNDFPALVAFYESFGTEQVKTGDIYDF